MVNAESRVSYQLPCCTHPLPIGQIKKRREIPQEFGLISSEMPVNHVNPQHQQEIKLQKRLKVSKQQEMKGSISSDALRAKCKQAALRTGTALNRKLFPSKTSLWKTVA